MHASYIPRSCSFASGSQHNVHKLLWKSCDTSLKEQHRSLIAVHVAEGLVFACLAWPTLVLIVKYVLRFSIIIIGSLEGNDIRLRPSTVGNCLNLIKWESARNEKTELHLCSGQIAYVLLEKKSMHNPNILIGRVDMKSWLLGISSVSRSRHMYTVWCRV